MCIEFGDGRRNEGRLDREIVVVPFVGLNVPGLRIAPEGNGHEAQREAQPEHRSLQGLQQHGVPQLKGLQQRAHSCVKAARAARARLVRQHELRRRL